MTSTALMKSLVKDKVGLMDENPNLMTVEDYDYWLRLLKFKDNSIYILKDRLIGYRIHGKNASAGNFKQVENLMRKHGHASSKLKKKLELNEIKIAYYRGNISLGGLLQDKRLNFYQKSIFIAKYFMRKMLGV